MQSGSAAVEAASQFSLKTEIVFGAAPLARLRQFRGSRVGIVTDAFMLKSGAVERIRAELPDCLVEVFGEIVPEPPIDVVVKGAALLAAFKPDVVVALGGGSPIDAAKAVTAILREIDASRRIVLVAVPTSSGTGSEVTAYAVISDPGQGRKLPLRSAGIVPDMAVLDPDLVKTAPPSVTADTGMDVLTHALEAYVSLGANDFTDAFAEKAVALAFRALPQAFADGADMAARTAMHNASCMAGLAFNGAGLGMNHSLAHAIGARLHIPHGRINAMLLPLVVAFNAATPDGGVSVAAPRYAALARSLGLEAATIRAGVKALARALARLNARIGIPASLAAHGIDRETVREAEPDLVRATLADGFLATNPRQPTPGEVAGLIRAVAG